jgi:vacuole membrane protein 1
LHTFVLYLGPHIALFTIKAVQCGRIDLKMAPYDTIQLKVGPSWLDKKCSEFGPPVYPASAHSVRIPVFDLLPQIQLEAVLWGIGTALGELPPYFISRAGKIACLFFFNYSDILLYATLYTISLIAVQKHYWPLYFF